MKPQIGTWMVILVAAALFLLPCANAVQAAEDGYGDFQNLFVRPGDEAADRDLAKSPAFDMRDNGEKPLSWAIPATRLPYNFTWLALFLDKGSRIVLSQVSALVVTTPVSGAALLLGSGILCLIGLRRRDRRQV